MKKLVFTAIALSLLCMSFLSYAQERITVTGVITGPGGEPLIGVNIIVEGTTQGTITDINGAYSIVVPSEETQLLFKYVGYADQRHIVGNNTSLNITLQEAVIKMDELILVGYSVKKKVNVIGAISSVEGHEIRDRPVAGLSQALQGKSAGLSVIQNSGAPGENAVIRVRGTGTVNNSNPLFIVDGVISGSIDYLNPNDIESVQVLKDAASAAIYGARGANGVILVTTRSGRTGKARVDIDYYIGIDDYWKKIEVLDSYEYQLMNNLYKQSNVFFNELLENGADWYYSQYEKINWLNDISRKGLYQNVGISVTGGTEQMDYFVSYNNMYQSGLVINSDFTRNNINLRLKTNLFGRSTLSFKSFYSGSDKNSIATGTGSLFRRALINPPINKYDPLYGTLTNNPYKEVISNSNNTKDERFNVSGKIDIPLFKGFHFSSLLAFNFSSDQSNTFGVRSDQFQVVVPDWSANSPNNIGNEIGNNKSVQWDNVLNYSLSSNKNNFGVNLVSSVESSNNQFVKGDIQSFLDSNIDLSYLNSGSLNQRVSGNASISRSLGFVGQVEYNYDEKYLTEFSLRADASSRFSKAQRWGYFPSAMVGWRISQEEFIKSLRWVDQMRLRFSVGNAGNNRIDNNSRFTMLNLGNYYPFGVEDIFIIYDGIAPNSIGNPSILWEKTTTYNAGFDFGIFNKIFGSVDYFERYTYDMLLRVPVVDMTGMTNYPWQNGGDAINRGTELELGFRENLTKDLVLEMKGTVAFIRNKVLKLGTSNDPVYDGNVGQSGFGQVTKTQVNGEIGAFWGYVTDGVYTSIEDVNEHNLIPVGASAQNMVGTIKFIDLNKDGKLDDQDRTLIGSPHPDFEYGFNMALKFKNLTLNMNWFGRYGQELFNYLAYDLNNFIGGDNANKTNIRADMLGKFFNNGSMWDHPEYYPINNSPNANPIQGQTVVQNLNYQNKASDYFIQDASFLRLSDITLSYNFPGKIQSKWNLENLRVFAGAKNLFTFTDYDGLDPEVGSKPGTEGRSTSMGIDYGTYPQSRTFFFGINIGI